MLHYGHALFVDGDFSAKVKIMKALVYTNPNALEWRDEPEPRPGNDEVLVRVDAVGICGSDMHAYHGHDFPPPSPAGARP